MNNDDDNGESSSVRDSIKFEIDVRKFDYLGEVFRWSVRKRVRGEEAQRGAFLSSILFMRLYLTVFACLAKGFFQCIYTFFFSNVVYYRVSRKKSGNMQLWIIAA